MTDDPNRKTLRQFQARDYLWDIFEQMSRELECSVDYLINEAMRHYARAQGRIQQTAPPSTRQAPPPVAAPMAPPLQARPMPNPAVPPAQQPMRQPAPVAAPMQRPQMARPNPMQAMPQQPPPLRQAMPPQMAPQAQQQMPPQYPRMPSAQGGYQPQAAPAPQGAVLYAVYEGQKYPITKDEFYIGRSQKSCDLIVKDPNVSRRHARIVRHQGQFWMIDMGSTNGIEHQGGRIERRQIAEGDVFKICDHEIAFTFR